MNKHKPYINIINSSKYISDIFPFGVSLARFEEILCFFLTQIIISQTPYQRHWLQLRIQHQQHRLGLFHLKRFKKDSCLFFHSKYLLLFLLLFFLLLWLIFYLQRFAMVSQFVLDPLPPHKKKLSDSDSQSLTRTSQ